MWTYSCLWSSDAIWRHIAISGSTLAQVMTCCLTAPNHCLKQYWLLISGVRWYSPESNFIASSPATNLQDEFENNTFWKCWNVSQCQWDKYHKRQKQIYVVHLPRKAYCALRYNYVTLAWGQQNRIVALSDDSWKVSKDTVSSWRRYLTVVVWSASRAYSISQEICTRFLLCCALLWLSIDWFPISIRLTSLALWQSIAPVPAKQPWWIWMNTSCEFIMNDCITTTQQSTTKPCAYFLGHTVWCWHKAEGIVDMGPF